MAEYIERDAVYKVINGTNSFSFSRNVMIEQMNTIPAADVVAVKHGRWLQPKTGECFCSECKTNGSPQWKRCPVCETKMDGGDNDA